LGELASGGAAGQRDIQFTGQRFDLENGLLGLTARHYDPRLGRFISADPTIPDANSTQDINPYSYANNNPVNLIDPNGTQACAAAQETCIPADNTLRFPAATITGRWTPPENRVHVGCTHCTLFYVPPDDSLTLEQAVQADLIRVGPQASVSYTGQPIQQAPAYDDFGVRMFGDFTALANLQATSISLYAGVLDFFKIGQAAVGASVSPSSRIDVSSRAATIHNQLLAGRVGLPAAGEAWAVEHAHQLRTTAVLEAVDSAGERWYLVASSGKNALTPAQRAILTLREIPVGILGNHAEINAMIRARQLGLRPLSIGASRAICPACARELGFTDILLDTPLRILH
jgi:RHS repeat-associated protein